MSYPGDRNHHPLLRDSLLYIITLTSEDTHIEGFLARSFQKIYKEGLVCRYKKEWRGACGIDFGLTPYTTSNITFSKSGAIVSLNIKSGYSSLGNWLL